MSITVRTWLAAGPVADSTQTVLACLMPRSVQLGGRPSVQPLMQSQQGGLRDLSWDLKAPGSIVTASSNGSVCVWDAQVGCSLHCLVSAPATGKPAVALHLSRTPPRWHASTYWSTSGTGLGLLRWRMHAHACVSLQPTHEPLPGVVAARQNRCWGWSAGWAYPGCQPSVWQRPHRSCCQAGQTASSTATAGAQQARSSSGARRCGPSQTHTYARTRRA